MTPVATRLGRLIRRTADRYGFGPPVVAAATRLLQRIDPPAPPPPLRLVHPEERP